jgi:hypothetical protein
MAWTRRLPSKRWQACYRDASGRTRTAGSFARKADAETAGEEESPGCGAASGSTPTALGRPCASGRRYGCRPSWTCGPQVARDCKESSPRTYSLPSATVR